MRVFVDTSAFLALVQENDSNHPIAQRIWPRLVKEHARFICTNYVLLETLALIQRRFGMEVVRHFQESIAIHLKVEWVDERLHKEGVAALIAANRRRLSLVDCVSFVVMREMGLKNVFAFDPHFSEEGFVNCY